MTGASIFGFDAEFAERRMRDRDSGSHALQRALSNDQFAEYCLASAIRDGLKIDARPFVEASFRFLAIDRRHGNEYDDDAVWEVVDRGSLRTQKGPAFSVSRIKPYPKECDVDPECCGLGSLIETGALFLIARDEGPAARPKFINGPQLMYYRVCANGDTCFNNMLIGRFGGRLFDLQFFTQIEVETLAAHFETRSKVGASVKKNTDEREEIDVHAELRFPTETLANPSINLTARLRALHRFRRKQEELGLEKLKRHPSGELNCGGEAMELIMIAQEKCPDVSIWSNPKLLPKLRERIRLMVMKEKERWEAAVAPEPCKRV